MTQCKPLAGEIRAFDLTALREIYELISYEVRDRTAAFLDDEPLDTLAKVIREQIKYDVINASSI